MTSRAVQRNCEAQGTAAGNAVRQQSVQVMKEGGATNQNRNADVEAKALSAQRKTFESCMLKYAV